MICQWYEITSTGNIPLGMKVCLVVKAEMTHNLSEAHKLFESKVQ